MNAHTSNAYTSARPVRWALLPLIVAALGACSGGPASDPDPSQRQAVAAPAGPGGGPAPVDTIDLRKIGYAIGAEGAPVTVYEFSDFGCPFCGMFARGTLPGLREEFVKTGKVRWTYVPVTFGFQGGQEGARAAECAADQGKFWEMHDQIFTKQTEWKASRDAERLASAYAREVGLDAPRFASCYRADGGAARTAVHNRAAEALRVRATPTFFVNGRLVEGALPAEQFRQILTMMAGGS